MHKRKYSAGAAIGGSRLHNQRVSAIANNRDTHTKLYTGFLAAFENYDKGAANKEKFTQDVKNLGIRPTPAFAEVLRQAPDGAAL